MSTFSNEPQKDPDSPSFELMSPPTSIVPITSAIATDGAVIVRLCLREVLESRRPDSNRGPLHYE